MNTQAPETSTLESWRRTFRDGLAPELDLGDLDHLRKVLRNDDRSWIQGQTTEPPSLHACMDWPVEQCCFISQVAIARGATMVSQVVEEFAYLCAAIDQRLGEPAACRWITNWHDEEPREIVRQGLLEEVEREIRLREGS